MEPNGLIAKGPLPMFLRLDSENAKWRQFQIQNKIIQNSVYLILFMSSILTQWSVFLPSHTESHSAAPMAGKADSTPAELSGFLWLGFFKVVFKEVSNVYCKIFLDSFHHHKVHSILFNLIYSMVYFDRYRYEKIDFEFYFILFFFAPDSTTLFI